MSRFLVIPHIRFQHANALQAWWLMAPPSPMTLYGFVRALEFALKRRHPNGFSGFPGIRLAIAHHGVQWLAATKAQDRYIKKLEGGREDKTWDVIFRNDRVIPQQPQGATYIDEQDHIGSGFAKSLQPTARCHGEISVVVDIGDSAITLDNVRDFLWSARLGGGAITEHGAVSTPESFEEITRIIGGGFWVSDRSDSVLQIMQKDGRDGTEALIQALADNAQQWMAYTKAAPAQQQKMEKPESWLSANVVGYAALEPLTARTGVRLGAPHAYAEPLVGLIRYCSVREERQVPFWRYHTIPEKGVYLMTGRHAAYNEGE